MNKRNRSGERRPWTAVGPIMLAFLIVSACGSSEIAGPSGVVGEFIDLRTSGQHVAALDLATAEVAEGSRDFFAADEVWNLRGALAEPCDETATGFRCVLSEDTDFHQAGGVSPWTLTLTFVVNETDQISAMDFDVLEWDTAIQPFNFEFWKWMRDAHPSEESLMGGPPMGSQFDAEKARIALEFVDEFVAQSDVYPIEP